jgi:hypothetical protein
MVEKSRALAAENKRVLSRLEAPEHCTARTLPSFSLTLASSHSFQSPITSTAIPSPDAAACDTGGRMCFSALWSLRAGPLSGWPHFPALRFTFPLLHQRLTHYTGNHAYSYRYPQS